MPSLLHKCLLGWAFGSLEERDVLFFRGVSFLYWFLMPLFLPALRPLFPFLFCSLKLRYGSALSFFLRFLHLIAFLSFRVLS